VGFNGNTRPHALGGAGGRIRLTMAWPGVSQQNPDEIHRKLFLAFLSKELARAGRFQTIIFTWLNSDEIRRLREQGTNVITPDGDHFLRLLSSEEPAQPSSLPE
jgi:hypothetical protein